MCVCDLTGAFELTGPTISHHLKVLREAGLDSAGLEALMMEVTGHEA